MERLMRQSFCGNHVVMAEIKILVGCGESSVTETIVVLLSYSCQVTARAHFDELVRDACAGEFGLVVVYGNCISPPYLCDGGLLENTVLAIKTIRASRAVTIVALTSTEEWCEPLRAAGANVCLGTPFTAAEFKAAVSGCLQCRA